MNPPARYFVRHRRSVRHVLLADAALHAPVHNNTCRILRISWDEAWGVMARAVARGQARKAARPYRYLGVDEKAFRKRYRFHTVVCDLERSTVEYVSEDRRVESLAPFFAQLMPEQRASIQAIAMDMWDPYMRATREGLPAGDARIVFDKFHIMRDMSAAVDTVRKQEHRVLSATERGSPLTGTKYLVSRVSVGSVRTHRINAPAAMDTNPMNVFATSSM